MSYQNAQTVFDVVIAVALVVLYAKHHIAVRACGMMVEVIDTLLDLDDMTDMRIRQARGLALTDEELGKLKRWSRHQ